MGSKKPVYFKTQKSRVIVSILLFYVAVCVGIPAAIGVALGSMETFLEGFLSMSIFSAAVALLVLLCLLLANWISKGTKKDNG